MQPPNWMLDRGWAVTAEIGGVTARDHSGPPATPAIAWLKGRPEPLTVVLGGRHLAAAGANPAAVIARVNRKPVEPAFPSLPTATSSG